MSETSFQYKGYVLYPQFTGTKKIYSGGMCDYFHYQIDTSDFEYAKNHFISFVDKTLEKDGVISCTLLEYNGFILSQLKYTDGYVRRVYCDEIGFSVSVGDTDHYLLIKKFERTVDKALTNNVVSYQDAEKELNRLKTLLKEQPAVFYGTRQVYDLLTLAEDLLAASKEDEKDPPFIQEYYKQLDRLAEWDKRIKYSPERLRKELVEIYALFQGVFELTLNDVKTDYCERANKE